MFRGQIFPEIQNAALRFQKTKNSLAGASCLTQSLFPGWTPISYCFHLAPITRQILRQISGTLSHKAPILWLSGELGEHNTSLGLEIMGRPFSKWIHINFCCEYVERGSCWLACLPARLPLSLSLILPTSTLPPTHCGCFIAACLAAQCSTEGWRPQRQWIVVVEKRGSAYWTVKGKAEAI